MDSDGEDKPTDLSLLIGESIKDRGIVIFASRKKRLETSLFKFLYFLQIHVEMHIIFPF